MQELKYYDLSIIDDPKEIKSIMAESISMLKQNALLTNFHKDDLREKYAEQVSVVQNYLTQMEIKLEHE
tara:strand:- start:140 stop:346 length:207 start_codon:yes stop_codon:yes gene_type:complete